MRGGYLRFQAQYLRRIRVPAPQTLSKMQSHELRDAFRHRDRSRATQVAMELYRITARMIEAALRVHSMRSRHHFLGQL